LAAASAVALRAHYRIGQISDALETSKNQYALSTSGKSKSEILKDAGISLAAACRDEQLTKIISEQRVEELCRAAVETGGLDTSSKDRARNLTNLLLVRLRARSANRCEHSCG
jgi:hypothetical protein